MKWYAAQLFFKSQISDDETEPILCDEQIRLIQAEDEGQAIQKACQLGETTHHDYLNVYGQTVQWVFLGLGGVEELSESSLQDGLQVHSRLFEHENPETLVI